MVQNNLKTAEKIFKVLDMYSKDKKEWGVTELSKNLNLSKTVVHRILKTLEDKGYLHQNSVNHKYSLGNRLIELGELAKNNINLIEIAEDEIKFLATKTGETSLIDIPKNNDNKSVCVHKIDSTYDIKYTCEIGKAVPIYAGAIGKTILAFMSEEKIDQIINMGLKKHTKNTTVNPDKLRSELYKIRQQGYSTSKGEWNPGGMGISAPIFSQGKIFASIGILGPEFRLSKNTPEYIGYCKEAANRITNKL